jgi:hypothetical protein
MLALGKGEVIVGWWHIILDADACRAVREYEGIASVERRDEVGD